MIGTVRTWNADRGYGFIRPYDGGADVFVHVSALPKDYGTPREGDRVSFETEPGRDNKTRAKDVKRV